MRYIGTSPFDLAVSVEDFKRSIHQADLDPSHDGKFEGLLAAAEAAVTTATGLPRGPGSYEFTYAMDDGPWRRWWFPCRPVHAITEIATMGNDGAWSVRELDGVLLLRGEDEPQMILPANWAGFADGAHAIRIRCSAGTDLLAQARRAIVALAKEWMDADISVGVDVAAPRLSMGAFPLVRQIRYTRPKVSA